MNIKYISFICTGYDGESNLSTVEVYDPVANEWTMGPPMCAHEGGVGAAVVPVI